MSKKANKECLKCNKKLLKKDISLTCCDCQKNAHVSCTKLTPEEVRQHTERGSLWRCRPCAKEGKKRNEAVSEIKKKSLRPIECGMGDAYDSIELKQNSSENLYKPECSDLQSALEMISNLKAKNESLNKEIETLAYRLDLTEQATRRNILEITGVPDKKSENMITLIKQIGSAIDFSVNEEMIDSCYRINRQQKPGYHAILIYFVRRYDKDAFLKAFRLQKTVLPKDIGRVGDTKIFVRESLSFSKRHLLMQARKVARGLSYKGVGVINGEIFMKESDSSEPVFVKEAKDLENVIKTAKK